MENLVSVVLPVYNGERYLKEAIDSVLAQRHRPLEILVVDDGSTDDSGEIAQRYSEVQYHRQDNQGPSAARNRGIQMARGEFVAFIDADDLWPEDKLHWQLQVLHQHPDCQMSLGTVLWEGLKRFHQPVLGFQFGVALCRRSLFEAVGLLDESLRMSEDVDWFMRVREKNQEVQVSNRVALRYRRHPENMTADSYHSGQHLARALRLSLARRRQQGQQGDLPELKGWGADPEIVQFMEERRQ